MNDLVHAFLSYSRKDQSAAHDTIARFHASRSCTVFSDILLKPGAEWERVLNVKITNADCFIALLSKSSIRSERCHREWAEAIECYKARGRPFLLPIRLDESKIPIEFRKLHAITWQDLEKTDTVDDVIERARQHDFWSDAFFESNLQLAFAKRTLEGGSWRTDVNDPEMREAQPEGVAHWLAVQDIRAAVHLTNAVQRLRAPRFDAPERGIEVVYGAKVDLSDRSKSAIALGLGFNKLTHGLMDPFEEPLFAITWDDVDRNGFKGRTDDFVLPGRDWAPSDRREKALIARIVLPRGHMPEAGRDETKRGFTAFFVCAGRTAPGTAAAGWFLANRWQKLLKLYHQRGLSLAQDSVAALLSHKADPSGEEEYENICEPAIDADGSWVYVTATAR